MHPCTLLMHPHARCDDVHSPRVKEQGYQGTSTRAHYDNKHPCTLRQQTPVHTTTTSTRAHYDNEHPCSALREHVPYPVRSKVQEQAPVHNNNTVPGSAVLAASKGVGTSVLARYMYIPKGTVPFGASDVRFGVGLKTTFCLLGCSNYLNYLEVLSRFVK